MAFSVVSIFVAATLVAITVASIIAWQLQEYADDNNSLASSLTTQNEQLYVTAAALELNRMTDYLHGELHRVRLATNQTQRLALSKANTPLIRTSTGALAVMNATLFDAWASRVTFPDELYGFGVTFLYPAGTDNVTTVQSIQTYADPLLTGSLQPIHSWTDPVSGLNLAYQINIPSDTTERAANRDNHVPQLDMSTVQYTFQFLDYVDLGIGSAGRLDQYHWQSVDGNPWTFFEHSSGLKIQGVNVVIQTFASTVDWGTKLTPLILSDNAYYVLFGKDQVPIASSYPAYEKRRLACIANNTGADLLGCVSTALSDDAELPLFQYLGLEVLPNASSLPRAGLISSTRYLRTTFGGSGVIIVIPEPIQLEGPNNETLQLVWFRFGTIDAVRASSSASSTVPLLLALILMSAVFSTAGVGALVYRSFISPMDGMVDQMVAVTELDTDAIDAAMSGRVARRQGAQFAEVRRLQDAFADMASSVQLFLLYLPRDVVRDLMSTRRSSDVPSFGLMEERELTVLFVDIRNFTEATAALRTRVQTFVDLLQTYFERTSGVLLDEGCTIDKYIGDAIMGFWGAPLDCPDQYALACRSALRLADEVEQMRPEFAAHGWDLGVRAGIHSGPAMVGSIGSKRRLNFTALGNTVNIASRLESLCKTTKTPILVSRAVLDGVTASLPCNGDDAKLAPTAAATPSAESVVVGDFVAYRVGLYQLKGTDEALAVYQLCGLSTDSTRRSSRGSHRPGGAYIRHLTALSSNAIEVLQNLHDGETSFEGGDVTESLLHFTRAKNNLMALSPNEALPLKRIAIDEALSMMAERCTTSAGRVLKMADK